MLSASTSARRGSSFFPRVGTAGAQVDVLPLRGRINHRAACSSFSKGSLGQGTVVRRDGKPGTSVEENLFTVYTDELVVLTTDVGHRA